VGGTVKVLDLDLRVEDPSTDIIVGGKTQAGFVLYDKDRVLLDSSTLTFEWRSAESANYLILFSLSDELASANVSTSSGTLNSSYTTWSMNIDCGGTETPIITIHLVLVFESATETSFFDVLFEHACSACFYNCSFPNGVCTNNHCVCSDGYYGEGCEWGELELLLQENFFGSIQFLFFCSSGGRLLL
jgi:hypothetical protein